MTNDTKSAAERLRDVWHAYNWDCVESDDQLCDVACLAHAYLREHPADDGEAVDGQWLLAVGFGDDYGELSLIGHVNDRDVCGLIYNPRLDAPWYYTAGTKNHTNTTTIPNGLRTRGDVRRLAAALGIELTKEAT